MPTDYHIQPFSLDSYPLIKELYLSAFKIELDYQSFIKKYDTKNLGYPVVGFLAIHKITKQPAAYYGVFPLKILIRKKEILVAQSGDTMTHSNHRRKGLFVHLAQLTFQACRKNEIQLIFGQPNIYSKHGLINSLKFLHLDDIIRYDLKLNIKTLPIPKLLKKLGYFHFYCKYAKTLLKHCIINDVKDFTNPLNILPLKILRDASYLAYKNAEDKVFVNINGTIIWIKFTDVLWIGDINNYDKIDNATIKKIKKIAFLLGYNTISFHFNKSVIKPAFLNYFNEYSSEASCFYYLQKKYYSENMLITGADFDTW